MRVLSFDLESHLIQPGQICPRMVCLTWAERGEAENEEEEAKDGIVRGIFDRVDGLDVASEWLADDDVCLIGHNSPFDLGVLVAEDPTLLPLVFEKLDKGLIRDTQVRQQLLDIATGEMKFHEDEDTGDMIKSSYGLADLSYRLLGKWLKKKDTWRLKYALLDGVPITEWEPEAKRYAIDDAVTTLEVYEAQDKIAGVGETCTEIPNAIPQHQAAWALHLMSVWGVRTDGPSVAKLKAELERDFAVAMLALRPTGLLTVKPARVPTRGALKGQTVPEKVTKNMRAIKERAIAAYAALGQDFPLTDTGLEMDEEAARATYKFCSTSKKTLVDSGDKQLKQLAEAGGLSKLLGTYIPVLESGTKVPINARYNVLVETGRTSCSKPNLQQPPRKGGVRECFVPRPGWVYAFCDYDTLELRALSQVCLDLFGHSEMAEALKRGEDLHLSLAAEMNDISYQEAKERYASGENAIKEDRQFAKVYNFGAPGGLGSESFVSYAEGYGIKITKEKAQEMKGTWLRRWPEMESYFAWGNSLSQIDEPVTQIRSGRVRGGASYCAILNGAFQGLASDGSKEATYRVARECYCEPTSPLFGCRPVFMIHDELGIEIPLQFIGAKRTSEAAERLSQVMKEAMRKWIPDVPINCKPVLMRRWLKGAEQVTQDGVIVPSKMSVIDVDGKRRTIWLADL